MTLAAYRELGGVAGALADAAERLFEAATGPGEPGVPVRSSSAW